jgi:ribosomal protein S18 acetylase RimI-like enzyme
MMRETWEDTYGSYFTAEQLPEARRLWLDALPLESALTDPRLFFLLAWEATTLLGFVAARLLDSNDLFLLRVYVHPAHQRRRIGTMLVNQAVAAFPDASAIRLDVEEGNARGVAFWKQQAFQETGRTRMTVAGVSISLISMEKHLA